MCSVRDRVARSAGPFGVVSSDEPIDSAATVPATPSTTAPINNHGRREVERDLEAGSGTPSGLCAGAPACGEGAGEGEGAGGAVGSGNADDARSAAISTSGASSAAKARNAAAIAAASG